MRSAVPSEKRIVRRIMMQDAHGRLALPAEDSRRCGLEKAERDQKNMSSSPDSCFSDVLF